VCLLSQNSTGSGHIDREMKRKKTNPLHDFLYSSYSELTRIIQPINLTWEMPSPVYGDITFLPLSVSTDSEALMCRM